jgi:enoyl-CoA hydratase
MQLLLTGETFPAARALEIGLVNAVVPDSDLQAAAEDLAARILRNSSAAIATVMTAVTRGINMSIAEGGSAFRSQGRTFRLAGATASELARLMA